MRRSPRLRILALLLAAALAATPAFAARREPVRASQPVLGVLGSLWQALERFLPQFHKGLGTIDPDGAPAPPSNAVPSGGEAEGLAGLDPDG